MQTARLRQTTLDRIRAKSAEATPLRPHWTDRPDAPRIQYSAIWWGSESPLAVCAVTVMDDADPRREYYPSAFRKLAERFQERLLTTPPKRAPRPPTIYLRRETFLAIPEAARHNIHNIWRKDDKVFATEQFSWDAVEYAVVIVDGRERIPKFVREIADNGRYQAPVYFRLARYPKAKARRLARDFLNHTPTPNFNPAKDPRPLLQEYAIWLLGGFLA